MTRLIRRVRFFLAIVWRPVTGPAGETPMTDRQVWRTINTRPGIRWEDDPHVWVIAFRVIDGQEAGEP